MHESFCSARYSLSVAGLVLFAPALIAQTNVLTYRNDNLRTALNSTETILAPANVNSSTFGKLFTFPVDGSVHAQPLVVSNLAIPGRGTHNVVFTVTEHDSVYAFDADTGASLWQVSALKAGETPSDDRGCFQISPEMGITATPVIDLAAGPHGAIYFVAMSKDASSKYYQRIHALDITTGAELFGGPTDILATFPGFGDGSNGSSVVFAPKQYKERTALTLVNGVVYTAWASHCDVRPYTGWTIGYNQFNLQQKGVFNFEPNGSYGGIWGAGGGAAADSSGNVFFAIGNGWFDPTIDAAGFPSNGDFGNAFVKVSTSNSAPQGLIAPDYWTMFNTAAESGFDQDLGSGGVMLLPDLTDANGVVRHLGVGAGKDKNIYVFDRDNMGKFHAGNNSTLYQQITNGLAGGEFASPAWFNGYVYYGAVNDVIRAFRVTNARLGNSPAFSSPTSNGYPGTSPSISASGTSNGILWAVENGSPTATLHAYDANNLVTELYNTNQATSGRDHFGPGNKYITPTIANGKVYVGTPTSVAAFGNFGVVGAPTITSLSPATGTQGAAVNVTITGTNFASPIQVRLSGLGASVSNAQFVNSTTITVTFTMTPTALLGIHNVYVITPGGNSNIVPFNVTAINPAPAITSVAPASGAQSKTVNVTITGSDFIAGSTVANSNPGVTVSNVNIVSATQITATLTIAASATTGVSYVTVTSTAGTSNNVPFNVTAAAVAPSITSVSPATGVQGSSVNVTLTGAAFTLTSTAAIAGSGVTLSNLAVVSPTQITATVVIAAGAAIGADNITVTSSAGTSNAVPFTVTAAPVAPTLSSVSPNSGVQGSTVNVTLTGANFLAGSTVGIAGSGVSLSNVAIVSATQITATLSISASATVGPQNITVTSTAGTSNALPFTVTAAPVAPSLSSVSPNSGVQGSTVNVTLTGANFLAGSTVGIAGSGVLLSNVAIVSATQITATLSISASATAGPQNITVTSSAGTSNAVPFTVTAAPVAPTLSSVSPNSGVQGTSVNVTLTGANFLAGSAVTVSGAGVSVGNVAIVSATQITATLSISAGATPGPYNIGVTTSAGSSNSAPFTVTAAQLGAPVITALNPGAGNPNTSVNLSIIGTGFTPDTAVRLAGVGAAVRNLNVVSSTQIDVTFVLSSTVALGGHNVYVITPNGSSNIVQFVVN